MATQPQPFRYAYYKYARDQQTFGRIANVIATNIALFNKRGVLSVRPGYKAVGGWITQKPAIVVTVQQKTDQIDSSQQLPAKVAGYAVDVREAGSLEKLRAADPGRFAQLAPVVRSEYVLPEFAGELSPSGAAVAPAFEAALAVGRAGTPEINYTAPQNARLDPVNEAMAITCHASPDAGWTELKGFFQGIKNTLTVGLYDFTSAHILTALESALTGAKKLTLTLDHPTKNPTANQTDDQTVSGLSQSLHDRFKSAWALVRSSSKAPEWIYPTAYHIKVAVRDSSAFWLSSGNWNNSNQPDIDPVHDNSPDTIKTASSSDRDWHVIVEHPGLAGTYEAFLSHDYDVAHQAESAPMAVGLPEAATLADDELAAIGADLVTAPRRAATFFPPQRIPASGTTKIKIQPILTPDNYHAQVLPLIEGAKHSFYMQTQYIHPSDNTQDQELADLITAIVDLQKRGVDVRIILSQWQVQGKGGWLEKLQATGIDLAGVRIQNGVHNKGIVVDSSVVMLGSQNWSGDGVIRNRDASVIIYNSDAAKYYESIFMHDWTNLAHQSPPL